MRHQSNTLAECAGLAHGFFTRKGGVSGGIYASLNGGPGSKDDPQAVAENRRRIVAELGAAQLLSLHQIHSAEAITVREAFTQKPQADAMVTDRPGLALGILSADCGPVLLADAQAGVIGAAHAGWKGATGGVLEETLTAMEALGAQRERIAAALGPTIAQASYEVSHDFFALLCKEDSENERFFASLPSPLLNAPPERGRQRERSLSFHFDLPAYILHRLRRAGLQRLEDLAMDTYANEAEWFSYRRATHRGEPDYGRQISAIMLQV